MPCCSDVAWKGCLNALFVLHCVLQDKAGAQEALLEWIDASVLPAEYGGSSTAGVGGRCAALDGCHACMHGR